ncbi:MAG: Hsp70 family protein [Acidimicrobiales bacterium]
MTYSIGLDLGTTASAAAIAADGGVSMFSVSHEDVVIPSVVYLGPDGTLLVGEPAERRAKSDPTGVAREFKRRFGDSLPLILQGSPVAANDLMLALATHLVDQVSVQQGAAPEQVVVCHPANWGNYKVSLLSDTLSNSSLPPHSLITEPAAAAIHGARQEHIEVGSVVAVYDLGGGTFDVALLRKLATGWEPVGRPGGIERLGGVDFDTAVLHHVVSSLGLDLTAFDDTDPAAIIAMDRLRDECREAKHALSVDTDAMIPVLLPGVNESVRITRAEFEGLIEPALRRTLQTFDTTVNASPVSMGDIDRVLLVGGSSRIPLVHQQVRSHTGRPVSAEAHPKHTVALGAAASTLQSGSPTPTSAPPPAPTPTPTPAQDTPPPTKPPVRDMYQLPHISEAPLPDFLSKRKPVGPPRSGHPEPTAPTPVSSPSPAAQQATSVTPVSPPWLGRSPPHPSNHHVSNHHVSNQRPRARSSRAGFFVLVVLLVAALGGGVYALIKSRSSSTTATNSTTVTTTIPPATQASTSSTTATTAVATTAFVGTPCRLADRPDPAIAYRVSDIPDDEVRQTLNGRNIPSVSPIDGVESVPMVEFDEFSILNLTYTDCAVDSRGRAWWGVDVDGLVVWSSTKFIEPAP